MSPDPAPCAWALHTELSIDEVNRRLPALEDAGLLGLAEQAGVTTVYLTKRRPLGLPGRWEAVADRDWNAVWKAGIEPVTAGEVTIVPPWLLDEEAAAGRVVLVIEPGQAFGTGHHATTVGCLLALQERALSGRSVLDVGTGTGVLGLAAARLGARRVLALDTDPVAVSTAERNALRNDCAVEVRAGSLDAGGDERFDVVVANLDTDTLKVLASDLLDRVGPGGHLILSGVSTRRQLEVLEALANEGMHPTVRGDQEWAVIVAVRDRPRV